MRKIAQGAPDTTRILALSSEGAGYAGQEAQPPRETHHQNLLNASEKGKGLSFPRQAVCKGAILATQLTRSAFPRLEAASCISKAPGLLIRWRPAGALGFNRSSPRAAEPLRGRTQGNHPTQPFICKLKGFLVPSLPLSSLLSSQ